MLKNFQTRKSYKKPVFIVAAAAVLLCALAAVCFWTGPKSEVKASYLPVSIGRDAIAVSITLSKSMLQNEGLFHEDAALAHELGQK